MKESPDAAKRFKVAWTPTLLVLDSKGEEHRRWEGYLPPTDFLAQLGLAEANTRFDHGQFDAAAGAFQAVATQFVETEAAPEALYWCGVSGYKASGDVSPLKSCWETLTQKHPNSDWTKKASFLFAQN